MSEIEFQTGTVYWPRTKGPFFLTAGFGSWREGQFDRGEIRDDLAHISDVGFDFVRLALPWEALQPDSQRLRSGLLDCLGTLLDLAQDVSLRAHLVLMGQFGGTLFLPAWLVADQPQALISRLRVIAGGWESPLPLGNLYEDERWLGAQRFIWQEIAINFAAHPALQALDLGAGGLLSSLPPRGAEVPFQWWQQLAEAASSGPELELLYSDRAHLLMQPELPKLHEWGAAVGPLGLTASPSGSLIARGGTDEAWPSFLLYLAGTLAGRPVGCVSLGVPASHMMVIEEDGPELPVHDEEEQARFFSNVLPALQRQGVPFICNALWSDPPFGQHGNPPFDLTPSLCYSGLLRADGSEKEVMDIWRAFNRSQKGEPPASEGRLLALDPEEWYGRRYEAGYVERLYQRFLHGEL